MDINPIIHLTESGLHAGRRLCLTDRFDGSRNVHASLAPLNNLQFRQSVCPECMKVWADEAYEPGDEMPDYIKAIRSDSV